MITKVRTFSFTWTEEPSALCLHQQWYLCPQGSIRELRRAFLSIDLLKRKGRDALYDRIVFNFTEVVIKRILNNFNKIINREFKSIICFVLHTPLSNSLPLKIKIVVR